MTFRFQITLVCSLFCSILYAQSDQKYLGQMPPGKTPEKFAPGLISLATEYEFGSTFSRDGKEFFYSVSVNGRGETRHMRLLDGQWTDPMVILAHEVFGYNDPMLSVEEDKLYFISTQSETESPEDYDIWYVERKGNSWSAPINAGPMINTEKSNEYYISFTETGAMYFASNKAAAPDRANDFDIYKSEFKEGKFQKARKMPFNSIYYEGDVFVAPDESYVIFSGENPDGMGRGDLYITFQNEGKWTDPINMGEKINDTGHQFCPFVTYDGKYLFFTSNRDIFWVDASIIEEYRIR